MHIEQVEEFISPENINIIKEDLKKINYSFQARLLDSSKYGVPQARKRAHGFMVDLLAFDMNEEAVEDNHKPDGDLREAGAPPHGPMPGGLWS